MESGRNGKGPCGKGQIGHWAKWESWARWLLGENEIGQNGKRGGQILGGMVKGRKKNGRNGKIWAKWDREK